MPGNSARRGAIRKTSKKPTAGSGGRVKRGLEGKGPTPKAKDRPNHKVYKQNAKADKAAAARPRRRTTGSEAEWIAGRNPVVEALRAGVPVTTVYVAEGAERDGRLRETFRLASERGIGLLEITKNELDRLTSGAVHQGLAAKIPAYEYPTTCSTGPPSRASRRSSSRSTPSPTRATWGLWCAVRPASARTAC